MSEEKSDYELLREANIRRNAEVMRALGLGDSDFMHHLRYKPKTEAASKRPKAAPKRARDAAPAGPARRSALVAVFEAEGAAEDGAPRDGDGDGGDERPRSSARELRASEEAHAEAEAEHNHFWAGRQKEGETIVGTARENLRKMGSRRAQPGVFAFPRGERH